MSERQHVAALLHDCLRVWNQGRSDRRFFLRKVKKGAIRWPFGRISCHIGGSNSQGVYFCASGGDNEGAEKTMKTHVNNLVLASSSPRRRALLSEAGIDHEVVSPPVDEPHDVAGGLSPAQLAEALAYFKARAVADEVDGAAVLGADTICAADGHVLGKPADADEARWMLRKLSSAPHFVITGVAVLGPSVGRLIASDVTRITMKPMSAADIEDYIATGEWDGKAGAYAIQESADRYVTEVDGSFSNVVGLPIELVGQMLRRVGIATRER